MAKPNHIRSISFPSRSHPSIQKVEEELNKLKTLQVSAAPEAATISSGLLGLEQLYKCMDDLLNLPQTLQALTQYQNKKWVDGLLEKSIKLLDICGLARDSISQLKEHLRDLQSSLRRRKGDSIASITRYTSFIKKMNKDAKKSIAAIKKIDDEIEGSTPLDVHRDISSVIKALREASAVSTSIFQSVLLFLSVAVSKPKPSRWSLVSKLVQSGRVACEYQHDNTCNLEVLEDIENKMESIFRRSHPSQKLEEELNELKILQVSASPEEATICSGVLGLEQLYEHRDDLLSRHTPFIPHPNIKISSGLKT
nr:uncharacterized protein LOC109167639 [Ipomoea trifida]